MAELSAHDEARLAGAVSVFFRLIALDGAWAAMAQRGPTSAASFDDAALIAEEMRPLIGQSVEDGFEVLRIARKAEPPPSLPQVLPVETLRIVQTVLDQDGGFVGMAESASNGFAADADSERASVDRQLARLRAGGIFDRVLSRRALCRLAKLLMAGGGISTVLPPHLHGPAAVAAGGAIYTANKCWEFEPAKAKAN